MPYEDDPRFAPYVFEESWLLFYELEADRIVLVIDATLSKTHPLTGPPRVGDVNRYEQIELRFAGVKGVRFEAKRLPPAWDATGEADYGNIDHFTVGSDGQYGLRGMTFGDLDFNARDCRITVLSRSWEN